MADTAHTRPAPRSVADQDRYRPPAQDEAVRVLVDGALHRGRVLGRNGPRVHVVFERAGGRYRRWVDATAVVSGADG